MDDSKVIRGYIHDIQPKQQNSTLELHFKKNDISLFPHGEKELIYLDLNKKQYEATINSTKNRIYIHTNLFCNNQNFKCTEIFLNLGLKEKAVLEFIKTSERTFKLSQIIDIGNWREGNDPEERNRNSNLSSLSKPLNSKILIECLTFKEIENNFNKESLSPKGIWEILISDLENSMPDWQNRIESLGQISKINLRNQGRKFSDIEVYEGIVHAIFTASTNYQNIKSNYSKIKSVYKNFDFNQVSSMNLFRSKKAIYDVLGFNGRYDSDDPSRIQNSLANKAINASRDIKRIVTRFGSMENYFRQYYHYDIDKIASSLIKGEYKVSGVGVAIVHEALKNIGFDTIKPDQHIKRIFFFFNWYKKNQGWNDPSKKFQFAEPILNGEQSKELIETAKSIQIKLDLPSLCFLDNVLWLVCAKSGLHYSNKQLEELKNTLNESQFRR